MKWRDWYIVDFAHRHWEILVIGVLVAILCWTNCNGFREPYHPPGTARCVGCNTP